MLVAGVAKGFAAIPAGGAVAAAKGLLPIAPPLVRSELPKTGPLDEFPLGAFVVFIREANGEEV